MKLKELKELNSEELAQKEKAFKKELFELNYQRRMGGVEKTHRFKSLRKIIAQILTIIRERDLANGQDAKTRK